MNQNLLTSQQLLDAAGITHEESRDATGIPAEYRHLLITSVLECVSAQKLRKALMHQGIKVATRDALAWLSETRDWLGLPPASPGKPSEKYRQAIKEWRQTNGNPTLDEIDAGWVPTHQRGETKHQMPKLSPKFQTLIEEFREQLACLNTAKDDEEVQRLMAGFLKMRDQKVATTGTRGTACTS